MVVRLAHVYFKGFFPLPYRAGGSEHSAQVSGNKYCARAESPIVVGRGGSEGERPRGLRPVTTITTAKSYAFKGGIIPEPLAIKAARARCYGAGRNSMQL